MVTYWIDTFRRTGKVDNEPNQGGKNRAHDNRDELVDKVKTLAHSGLCSPSIPFVLRKEGVEVSDRSVRRWLQESGWAYQPVKVVPKLDEEAKMKRVGCVEQHIHFDWSKVLFTDSKIFRGIIMPAQAKKERAWASSGQVPRVQARKYASYQVHVYGGISIYGDTDLHIVTGTTGVQSLYKQVGGRNNGPYYKGVCA